MINNYALFYSYNHTGDLLEVRISDKEHDTVIKHEGIDVLYASKELVAYNIHQISKIMKIHADGLIPYPNNIMIDVINSLLCKEGLENLSYKDNSGFVIGKVISENKIDLGNTRFVFENKLLNKNNLVVVALPNVVLGTGKRTKTYHVCTYEDLAIESLDLNDVVVVDEACNVGDDFFKMEAK